MLRRLVPGLSAGLIAGVRTLLGSAAMVSLIMPATLPGGVAPALQLLLVGGAVLAAVVAALGSYPGTVAQVQDGPAVILGGMAGAMAGTLQGTLTPEAIVLLVLAAANVAACLAGLVFYLLGRYRLGALVRFMPHPVIGGFLAGSGLLILIGALRVLAGGDPLALAGPAALAPTHLALWLPGLAFGAAMLWLLRRYSHPLLVPGLLLGGVLAYHAGLALAGMSSAQAAAAGLLLGPLPDHVGLPVPPWTQLPAAGWAQLASHAPTFAVIVLVSVVALLLNATGLELATRSDVDINRELRACGAANIAAGLLGGTLGFHALSASLLGQRMGIHSRLVGGMAAALCALALVAGVSLLGPMPKAVLGGLLVSMGAGLLLEWLWDGARRLSWPDYGIVWLIVGVVGSVGILAGVAVGLVVAMAIFVLSYSRVRVVRQELSGTDYRSNVDRSPAALAVLRAQGHAVRVMKLEGYLFFGTAYSLLTQVQRRLAEQAGPPQYLIIDFRDVPAIDSSAVAAFAKILALCRRHGCEPIFTRLHPGPQRLLTQADAGPGGVQPRCFDDLDRALEHVEEALLAAHGPLTDADSRSIWERIAAALPPGVPLAAFQAYLEPRDYRAGEYLLRQGDTPGEILFIESGRITTTLSLPGDRSVRLRSTTTGTMVGEIGLYLQQPRSASAMADGPTRAHVLTAARLREMEQRDPLLANALHCVVVALLAERLASINGLVRGLVD